MKKKFTSLVLMITIVSNTLAFAGNPNSSTFDHGDPSDSKKEYKTDEPEKNNYYGVEQPSESIEMPEFHAQTNLHDTDLESQHPNPTAPRQFQLPKVSLPAVSLPTFNMPDFQAPSISTKQLLGLGSLVLMVGAGASIYACVYTSTIANQSWTQLDAVENNATSLSAAVRNTCRISPQWQAACKLVDPSACQNQDQYNVQGDSDNVVSWTFGDCGSWDNIERDTYTEVWTCQTTCSTNSNTGKQTCQQNCYWQRELQSSEDLTKLRDDCPNKAYADFLNSTSYTICSQVDDQIKPIAQGYTAGAFFSALSAFICGTGSMILAAEMNN